MRSFAVLLFAGLSAFGQPIHPFTVTEISRHAGVANQSATESRFLFAMNRDGSIVSVDLDPSSGSTRQIIDVVKHRSVLVTPNSRSAVFSRYYGPAPQFGSPEACEQRFKNVRDAAISVDKSAGEIQGMELQRISIGVPTGLTTEIFVAPSLSCHIMKAQTFRNGILLESQTSEDLRLGDPDPRLFEVPADYRLTDATFSRK